MYFRGRRVLCGVEKGQDVQMRQFERARAFEFNKAKQPPVTTFGCFRNHDGAQPAYQVSADYSTQQRHRLFETKKCISDLKLVVSYYSSGFLHSYALIILT